MKLGLIFLKKPIILISLLIIIGFFVYSFNLNNDLFWDDDDWIINNNFVHTISWDNIKFWLTHNTLAGVGLKSNYYRPFLFFTFALNYIISGIKPLGYHLFSNLIHIANGLLVFSILHSVFKKKLLAFLTSLIFLIHPLQTEAVAYISGRGDLLVAFFMLLALLFFYKSETTESAIRPDQKIEDSRQSRNYSLLAIGSLVLGLLSRETGIIFPILALAFYVSVISNDKFVVSVKRGLIKTWPYFLVVFVYGILRLTVLNFQNTLNFDTIPNLYSENLHYRLFTFMHVLIDYFKLLFVPTDLHMERSMVVHTSLFQWPVWLGILVIVTLLYCLIVMYRRERFNNLAIKQLSNITIKQYSNYRIWFFGWAWFFIALTPVSGITPINAVIYEHWLYLPMVGFWLIISFYLVKLFDFIKNRRFLFVICVLLFGIYVSFLGLQSIKRNVLWGNPIAFYLDILKYEPDSVRINNNIGNLYFNRQDLENAEKYYGIATSQEDIFAEPHFNLGSILQSRGDIYGAIKLYEKAIEINPNFYYPYQNLAVIYAQQGNLAKAMENIEKLKLIISNNPRIYYNSALVYIALNNKEQALKDLQTGLRYIESDPETGKLIEELIEELQK